ncbi:prolipoprotein diacylglyceryl transferase [Clostridium sp. D2Q-11]|uniref:Phosphatidylglycerol--prolipoprotein diacylglyceryl transferase n=1 Tax=Anaeromonas frigoriresistens TaxID=2683708 RepID=A0A942Z806_9FIRM|nr:prolipoprotein diacylglyceryl transferase [Anaeromonas frigoriresistens]MBS4540096.1 prolipoprotein diacylglyceryl transferase [Anaeromonas frigoriresistens]
MNPIAFEIFGVGVRWYGIFIATGMVLGTILAIKESKRVGFDEEELINMLLFAIPMAIVGARLYYVIFQWDYYQGDIMKMINIRSGGLAIHGGIIGSVLTAIIFCKVRGISFWKVADITAPSIILGQAIGRWGNFVNQEAYGRETDLPWAITVEGVNVHPTFLYESIWNVLVFIFLLWYRKNKKEVEGEVFLLYLAFYSVGRFFIEGLRTDSLMYGPFRVAQLISIGLIVVSLGVFFVKRKRKM